MHRTLITICAFALAIAACGGDAADDSTTTAATDAPATTAATTTEASTTTAATTTTEATTTEATTTTGATTTSGATTTTGAPVELSGFLITEVVFGDHVTLTNNTAAAIDLDGWWLCNRPQYLPLSGMLEPGESVQITDLGVPADGGEVALYRSNSFGSSDDIRDYVAWGDGGGRESVAVGAGLWTADEAAPNDGAGIVRIADPSAASSWTSS